MFADIRGFPCRFRLYTLLRCQKLSGFHRDTPFSQYLRIPYAVLSLVELYNVMACNIRCFALRRTTFKTFFTPSEQIIKNYWTLQIAGTTRQVISVRSPMCGMVL